MSEIIPYNRNLKLYARSLRNNMTLTEQLLWSKIKGRKILNLQFCRQLRIESFILDFYCKQIKLAIEVDGPIHLTVGNLTRDANRDYVLNSYGILVLRFSNNQVLNNLPNVIATIKYNCEILQNT